MAICPVCQTENAGDFGLVNCKSCGSPFIVDFDGNAASAPVPPEAREASNDGPPAAAFEPPPPPTLETFEDVAPPPIVAEYQTLGAGSIPQEVPTPPPSAPPIEDLRQIADYGNSDVSLAREGAYRFTLQINGIDTAEIRQEVRDNLADQRFLWDIDALLAKIKDGELIISDVSAVKAALAIQRLKLLPVELKWEQHAIHQNN